jgi:hypothetical protein
MCGFQRLASRIATLPAAPAGSIRLRASARALTTPDHVQLFQTIQGFENARHRARRIADGAGNRRAGRSAAAGRAGGVSSSCRFSVGAFSRIGVGYSCRIGAGYSCRIGAGYSNRVGVGSFCRVGAGAPACAVFACRTAAVRICTG